VQAARSWAIRRAAITRAAVGGAAARPNPACAPVRSVLLAAPFCATPLTPPQGLLFEFHQGALVLGVAHHLQHRPGALRLAPHVVCGRAEGGGQGRAARGARWVAGSAAAGALPVPRPPPARKALRPPRPAPPQPPAHVTASRWTCPRCRGSSGCGSAAAWPAAARGLRRGLRAAAAAAGRDAAGRRGGGGGHGACGTGRTVQRGGGPRRGPARPRGTEARHRGARARALGRARPSCPGPARGDAGGGTAAPRRAWNPTARGPGAPGGRGVAGRGSRSRARRSGGALRAAWSVLCGWSDGADRFARLYSAGKAQHPAPSGLPVGRAPPHFTGAAARAWGPSDRRLRRHEALLASRPRPRAPTPRRRRHARPPSARGPLTQPLTRARLGDGDDGAPTLSAHAASWQQPNLKHTSKRPPAARPAAPPAAPHPVPQRQVPGVAHLRAHGREPSLGFATR
jgi:hypothetical protein